MSGTTVMRFQLSLSDVERELFTEIDLRIARHPSETGEYLVTRVLAAALLWQEGLTFASAGISDKERPALYVEDGSRVLLWIEIGAPGADRVEKAGKKGQRVVLVTTDVPRNVKTVEKAGAHVEIIGLPRAQVERLADGLDARQVKWQLTVSGGTLFVSDERGLSEELVIERVVVGGD
jgi:uncharacterized protein YaeQ